MGKGRLAPPINDALRTAAETASDWRFVELSSQFNQWIDRLNQELHLELTTPVLVGQRVRCPHLGCYKQGRNAFGVYHQITVNPDSQEQPLALQLVGLCRELLKEWQILHGQPGC